MNEALEKYKKQLNEMPACLEKTIIGIIFKILLRKNLTCDNKETNNNMESDELFDKINQNLLKQVENRLEIEYADNLDLKNLFNEISKSLNNNDLNLAIKNLDKFLKIIRPLDIVETLDLAKKSLEKLEKIKDKDVFFLLGKTGSGKSTTLHFLSGSKMVKRKIELNTNVFIEHIEPEEPFLNSDLKLVTSSYKAESETRYIIPIAINIKQIGGFEDKDILICDTPGFGDTSGAEIDISNSIAIIKAVNSAKSVKPIFVFNFKDIGSRGEGIREFAHFLVELVANIQDNLSAFSYIFTNFQNQNVHGELFNIKKSVDNDKELSEDTLFNDVLIDMLEKTATSKLNLDPLNDKPYNLYILLKNTPKIVSPNRVFRFTIKDKTKKTIEDQIRNNEKIVIKACKRSEYSLIKWKVNELILLNEMLKYDFIDQHINGICKNVYEIINNEYKSMVTSFNNYFIQNNKISKEIIEEYKTKIEKFKDLKCLENFELIKPLTGYSDSLVQNLINKIAELLEINKNKDLVDTDLKTNIDNIKIISSIFSEFNEYYVKSRDEILNRIQHMLAKIKSHLLKHEFNEISQILNLINRAIEIFDEHIDKEEFQKQKGIIKELILESLNKISNGIKSNISCKPLHDNHVKSIENSLNLITEAAEYLKSTHLFEKNDLDEIYQDNVSEIVKNCDLFVDQINNLFEQRDSFREIGLIFDQMKKIRKIPIIEIKTAEKFHKTYQNIIGTLSRTAKETEDILYKLLANDENTSTNLDYEPINKYLNYLKNAEWINNYTEGTYDNLLKTIKENLIRHTKKLQEKILDIEIDLDNLENIEKAYQNVQKIERIKVLENLFDEIKVLKKEAVDYFYKILENIIDLIKKKFDLKNSANEISANNQMQYQSESQQSLTFEYINLEFSEKSLKFLTVSRILREPSIRNLIQSTRYDVENYLLNYKQFIQSEINECFNHLQHVNESNFKYSNKLKERFTELKEIEDKYPLLKEKLNSGFILNNEKESLRQNYFSLEDKLCQDSEQNNNLQRELNLVKAFSILDSFIEKEKFNELYKKYRSAATKEYKEFHKRIINCIERYDFKDLATELSVINNQQINERAFNQIKNLLTSSIIELIENTKINIILMSNTLKTDCVREIIQNIRRLETAQKLIPSVDIDIIDNDTKLRLESGIIEIKNLISDKILRYLENIGALIKNNNFYEAEEKREHLNNLIKSLLGSYCQSEDITTKLNKIQEDLENIVSILVTNFQNTDLEKYIFESPKIIFDNLKKVEDRNNKYKESLNKIKQIVFDKIDEKLNKALNSTSTERNDSFLLIESILRSLPDEMRVLFDNKFQNSKKEITDRQNQYEKELEDIKTNFNAERIKIFIEKCEKHGFDNMLLKSNEVIFQKIANIKQSLHISLKENDLKKAFYYLKKLIDYKLMFCEKLKSIEYLFSEIKTRFVELYDNHIKNLLYIHSNSNEELILNSFNYYRSYIEFKHDIELNKEKCNTVAELDEIISKNSEKIHNKMIAFFENFHLEIDTLLKDKVINRIYYIMSDMRKWDNLLKKFKEYSVNFLKNNIDLFSKIETLTSFDGFKDKLSNFFLTINDEILKFNLFNGLSKNREDFYKEFVKNLNILVKSQELGTFINEKIYITDSSDQVCVFVENKFKLSVNDALNVLDKNETLKKRDFDKCSLCYDNLIEFKKYSHLTKIDLNMYIEKLDNKVLQKVFDYTSIISKADYSLEDFASSLINIKLFAENLLNFKDLFNEKIDEILSKFKNNNKDYAIKLVRISNFLEKDPSGIGINIISEHLIFKGIQIQIFNHEVQRHDIEYILERLKGDNINKEQLKLNFETYEKTYKELLKQYIFQKDSSVSNDDIVKKLKRLIKEIPDKFIKSALNKWDSYNRSNIICLVAHIFCLWTLKSANFYYEMENSEKKEQFLLTPHPGQVIAIFRLLGLGYHKLDKKKQFLNTITKHFVETEYDEIILDKLQNNFVQVGTGEGKSLIFAVASIILALLGYEVSCACYSEYLSLRDYEAFLPMFELLDITKFIHYGTFNKICENLINENGDIRSRVLSLISNKPSELSFNSSKKRPKILLVDEVDVFFGADFYGNVYTPLTRLYDPSIIKLTDYIWNNRNDRNKLNLKTIELTDNYIECCKNFKDWEFLIKEAVKDMINDVANFNHDYFVHENKIAYKEQDGISYKVVYGYKTLFAYYDEVEKNKISRASLEENVSINIRCGSFSYAAIPSQFQYIMGVTGTLQTLSKKEQEIVTNKYNILMNTYIPSVFGKNKRQFAKEADIYIENKDDYFTRLIEKIDQSLNGNKRAVLVFFQDKNSLNEFHNSKHFSSIKGDVQLITEEVSSFAKEKEKLIKRATSSGQITLLTKVFGRGTDFVCRDENVNNNCGVHVIQTFFSNELSEEIQIMGRTARQGKDGSYSMILLDSDLEVFLGVEYKEKIKEMRNNKNTYDQLNDKRNEIFDTKYTVLNNHIIEADEEHKNGQKFIEYLDNNQIDLIKSFLGERNIGASEKKDSKTICLMDATGSMGGLLLQAKNTVGTMFNRASLILKEHDMPPDIFQVQFVVYRDYDCLKEGLLEYSPWESKPDQLRQFMDKITAKGGIDYEEAIEIGLWHANREAELSEVSQVILIGDAPAKDKKQIAEYRKTYGGEDYWMKTPFKDITFYQDELLNLKAKNIPVHAFYLHSGNKNNFEEIASKTGGVCNFLDINSSAGSDLLTDLVTERILSNIGQSRGKGDELVNAYKSKFSRTYA